MTNPRINALEAPFETAVADTFARSLPPGFPPLKLFRTQAHNPRVLQRMFAGNLLDPGALDQRARELLILRTCARCGSEYEWGVHVALFSQQAGLSARDVAQTCRDSSASSSLPAHEALLLAAADQLHDTATIADDLWEQLAAHYSSPQLIEIVALVGHYHAISFITNAARIELEEFAPRFPRVPPSTRVRQRQAGCCIRNAVKKADSRLRQASQRCTCPIKKTTPASLARGGVVNWGRRLRCYDITVSRTGPR